MNDHAPCLRDEAVGFAPPPPRIEPMPPPRAGYTWVPGYWDWQNHRHVWVVGHWAPERRGYHWLRHRWVLRDGRWHLQQGGWAADAWSGAKVVTLGD